MANAHRSRSGGGQRPARLGVSVRKAAILIMAAMPLMAASPHYPAAPSPPAPNRPIPTGFDYAGLIHVHTAYSDDATGTYAGRALTAAKQGIQFVIITDHDTLGPGVTGGDGWRDGVLMLTGVESSRTEGHLLAVGMETAPLSHGTSTDSFLASVTGQGGLAVVAHPTHRKWAWEGPIDDRIGAMEILDLADQFAASSTAQKLAALAALPVAGPRAYLTMAARPDTALALWDRIGQRRRMVGLYAPDIHEALELSDDVKVPFPPAGDIMRLARNHVLTTHALTGKLASDRATLLSAIGAGRLYVSLDILGDGRGFNFAAIAGPGRFEMGSEAPAGPPYHFEVVVPDVGERLGASIRLLRDGRVIAAARPGVTTLSHIDARPGVYRVEVSVPATGVGHTGKDLVWIYSNPVYLRARSTPPG